jgi:hypothetical protein
MNTILGWFAEKLILPHWFWVVEYFIAFLFTFWLTYVFYAAVIMFRNMRDAGTLEGLTPAVIVMIKLALYVGLVLDAILNWVFLTAAFWEFPKEVLSTFRVKRFYWGEEGWRKKRAVWFAKNWLLPIDPHHMDQ